MTIPGEIVSLDLSLVGYLDADQAEFYLDGAVPAQERYVFTTEVFTRWRQAKNATFTIAADDAALRALPTTFKVTGAQPDGTGLLTLQLYAE